MQISSKYILSTGLFIGIWIIIFNFELDLAKLLVNSELEISVIFNDILLIFNPLLILILGILTIALSIFFYVLLLTSEPKNNLNLNSRDSMNLRKSNILSQYEILGTTIGILFSALVILYLRGILDMQNLGTKLILDVLILGICIFIHEFIHKFTAVHFRTIIKLQISKLGLFILLTSIFIGFPLVAMGIVIWKDEKSSSVEIDKRKLKIRGYVSASGPISNLTLIGVSYIILSIGMSMSGQGWGNLLSYLGYIGVSYNVFIGLSHLLPIGNLDGSNVLMWNGRIWFILLGIFVFLGTLGGGFGLF